MLDDGGRDAAGIASLANTRAVLQEAMRLWPTTPMLARETTSTLRWDGVRVDAERSGPIVYAFHHRDRERLDVTVIGWLALCVAVLVGPGPCPTPCLAVIDGYGRPQSVQDQRLIKATDGSA